MESNEMILEFDSKSENVSFARLVVAAFVSQLDLTIEEIADIKTAVSEAVTNCIIHGYEEGPGRITLKCAVTDGCFTVEIIDKGVGIVDIDRAREPLYTTKPNMERSGMGFAFMEAFMDEVFVESKVGEGTTVKMIRKMSRRAKAGIKIS